MTKTFIVIDEFYDNPMEIRNEIISRGFPPASPNATYPGRNSDISFYPEWMDERISSIVGEKVESTPGQMNGNFRISLKGDKYQQDIHIDGVEENHWAGVLYLSKPEDCVDSSGYPYPMTCTWRHLETGMERMPISLEEGKQLGFSSWDDFRKKIILDGIDRSKWIPTNVTYAKFNRLVLFRPWMYHSAGVPDGLGDNLENGRLVQIFFWKKA